MEEKKPAGLAIASMVLGIVSLLLGCCLSLFGLSGVALLPAIIGLVLGIIALKKFKEGVAGGKGMAIAGLIMNVLALLSAILEIAFLGAIIASSMADYM